MDQITGVSLKSKFLSLGAFPAPDAKLTQARSDTIDTRMQFGIHGGAVTALPTPVQLLRPMGAPFSEGSLQTLAKAMEANPDKLSNEPDSEENPFVPAGYAHFGQFVDHDLTFDTTSSFNTGNAVAGNERTPRLDLDCLYGSGPDDRPFMYQSDGASLIDAGNDLPRAANNRAIIGEFVSIHESRSHSNALPGADHGRWFPSSTTQERKIQQ